LSLADRWLLSRLQQLIQRSTQLFHQYDYATAKSEIEQFFWRDLADNYLEMAKQRLYDGSDPGAQFTLYHALLTTIKLFAPFLPYVTEQIYQGLFAEGETDSIHRADWPIVDESLWDETAVSHGNLLIEIATAVRRYKSEHNLSLGTELAELQLQTADPQLAQTLAHGITDLQSITRAQTIQFVEHTNGYEGIDLDEGLRLAIVA
jgi:valyl-tRNA synthetase